MMKKKKIPILYEDDQIIVCEKPAGMPVQPDHSRDLDVQTRLKHRFYERDLMDEEPWLEAVHRLDRPVGGLMVFARTKEAAASLNRQIVDNRFEKYYISLISQ